MRGVTRAAGVSAAGITAAALGAFAVAQPQLAFVGAVALSAVAAVAAPAGAWVLAALVAALTFKGLVSIHLLPSVATYMDLPLAWGALFVGLSKRHRRSLFVSKYLALLVILAVAVFLAWLFNPSEVLRPILYLMLLGEPFAIVGALLADPPTPKVRSALKLALVVLTLVQIPLALLELIKIGPSDHIQGTLYLAGAGADVVSAICVVGGIWILNGGTEWSRGARLACAGLLFGIPFVADAKQVIIALPAILLASSWHVSRSWWIGRIVLVAGSVAALFVFDPAGNTALNFLSQAQHGHSGKKAAASFVWKKLDSDPVALAFGKGPAETVSRAAFMTTFTNDPGPLARLGLKPAAIAVEAEGVALAATSRVGGATSFNSGISSTLGVLGDLGILGFSAYLALLVYLFRPLRKVRSPEGIAAASGFALFLVLGLVFDWWEQPPFSVYLGVLAGLALTASSATMHDSGAGLEPET